MQGDKPKQRGFPEVKIVEMDTSTHNLPFVPPVEGCRVERVHHIGPFVTEVRLRLPDGQPLVWRSRQHRFTGGLSTSPSDEHTGRERARWWLKAGLFARIIWWVSACFVIGSGCFAISSAAGMAPGLLGAFAKSTTAINIVFFIGSIFFTTAAYLQFLAAVNADRIAALAHRLQPLGKFRWFGWNPMAIGWLSACSQLVGTLLFNLNTFDALLPGLDWLQEDLLIWTPDVLGSICFLAASALALLEYGNGRLTRNLRDVSWWIVNLNMMGSLAFGVAAVFALVLPGATDVLDAWLVNATTLLGALCFMIAAVLLLPELGRNLRRMVAHIPDG
jgi:hypothetical protein